MQHSISKTFLKMPACYINFIVVPAFLIISVVTADPFRLSEFLDMGRGLSSFNLSIVGAIALGTLTLMRMILFILRKHLKINWSIYVLWCFMEIFIFCIFSSLYLRLMMDGGMSYYDIMKRSFLQFGVIMAIPYIIIALSIQCHVLRRQKSAAKLEESPLVRFYDENKRLRLVIARDAILFIKAEENYVRIRHLENGAVKDYTLRASMRSLEEPLSRHGIMRSHRSYYINPAHIRLVKKDSAGLTFAEMDVDGVESIPISKNYYDSLSKIL